ncbi:MULTISPECIES: hypothetical protein [Nocardiopsis]|uniref:Uncharacterized protein n=1 Tax=Nocardiopsis akebiae TaxID=2831968 RepID=A0ABX8C198_9ACTN|nr:MULTISPECIES: hypothetical protein [Nocardiopsis]QUX26886.1 hypothetical protein KGD83_16075 [Nocardiopsis akebiae]
MSVPLKTHEIQLLEAPSGVRVPIDRELVPLVLRLWSLGMNTRASCQNFGESLKGSGPGMPPGDPRWSAFYTDRVWLKLRPAPAEHLITLLGADRDICIAMNEWGRAESWLCVRPVVPDVYGGPARTRDTHLFFPREHLDHVLEVLGRPESVPFRPYAVRSM